MTTIRPYMIDACIAVKLVVRSEDGHAAAEGLFKMASWIEMTPQSVTEAYGVLKRKWLSKHPSDKFSDDQYHKATYLLNAFLKERVTIVGDTLFDSHILFSATQKSKEYGIDVLDCLQLFAAKKLQSKGFIGDSMPVFITADRTLKAAAIKEGVLCWEIEEAFEYESKNSADRLKPL